MTQRQRDLVSAADTAGSPIWAQIGLDPALEDLVDIQNSGSGPGDVARRHRSRLDPELWT